MAVRKQGDYTDPFEPLEVIMDVFFWDEDRKRQFKATHRLSSEIFGVQSDSRFSVASRGYEALAVAARGMRRRFFASG